MKVRCRKPAAAVAELQANYQQWLDALPESLADTPTVDALRAVCDLDLSSLEIDPPSRLRTRLKRRLLESKRARVKPCTNKVN